MGEAPNHIFGEYGWGLCCIQNLLYAWNMKNNLPGFDYENAPLPELPPGYHYEVPTTIYRGHDSKKYMHIMIMSTPDDTMVSRVTFRITDCGDSTPHKNRYMAANNLRRITSFNLGPSTELVASLAGTFNRNPQMEN